MLNGVKGLKTAAGCPPWTPLYRTPCLFPHARPQRGSADDGKRLHALDVLVVAVFRVRGRGRGGGRGNPVADDGKRLHALDVSWELVLQGEG